MHGILSRNGGTLGRPNLGNDIGHSDSREIRTITKVKEKLRDIARERRASAVSS